MIKDIDELLLDLHDYNGDSGEIQDSDWILEGESQLMKEIKKLPKILNHKFIVNQYHLPEWKTSCTKFAAMNALWNDMDYTLSIEDVFEIEEDSRKVGRPGTGRGRFRGGGVDVARNWWNRKFPNNEVASFLITLFSDEFFEFLDTGRCVVVSISVNIRFWADVLQNGRLDSMDFGTGGGHATTIYKEDGLIRFIDSVGTTRSGLLGGRTYTMTEAQLKQKIQKYTLQQTGHIFIPKYIVPMVAKDVPANRRSAEAIRWIIEQGEMTLDKDGKFNPSYVVTREMYAQAQYNKAKKEGKVK